MVNTQGPGMDFGEFLTRKQAALYLTSIGCPISHRTLDNLAANSNAGKGPPFTVTGWRSVWYSRDDLDAWAMQRMRRVE